MTNNLYTPPPSPPATPLHIAHAWPAPGALLAQAAAPPPTAGDSAPATTQTAPGGLGGPQGQPAPKSPLGNGFFLIILLMMTAVFLPTIFAGKKQKKQRARMLASLRKHDRVQTIGGVIGVIADVREHEVVVKVDDAANTRIRFARSAIQQVLRRAGSGDDDAIDTPIEPALQTAGVN